MTSVCAKWYEHSGDKWFKEEACRFFNHASYMAEPDGVVPTGHNWVARFGLVMVILIISAILSKALRLHLNGHPLARIICCAQLQQFKK
jgi:hypothetical protein